MDHPNTELVQYSSPHCIQVSGILIATVFCFNFRPTGSGYTDEEKKVIISTSVINGREYLPFMEAIDLKER